MLVSRRIAVSGLVLAGVAPLAPARAYENAALYQATAIVTGSDMRQRPLGFRRCLIEVLTKLTGMPKLASDAAAVTLADKAEGLVASYDYADPRAGLLHHDDQGTYDRSYELTVRFDPAKIDQALTTLGLAVWRSPRPLLNPVVLVRDREPTPFLLSAGEPRAREMRAAVIRSSGELGIGVQFPTDADLAAMAVGLIGLPNPLTTAGAGLARVTGGLSWNVHAMGWIGSWRMPSGDAEHAWGISGVGFDEALANMVQGAVMLAAGTGTP